MNDPSENTAELSVAKELSLIGTAVPRILHQFGSEIGMKRMPALASSALNVRNRIKHGIDCDALIAAELAIRAGVAGSSSIV